MGFLITPVDVLLHLMNLVLPMIVAVALSLIIKKRKNQWNARIKTTKSLVAEALLKCVRPFSPLARGASSVRAWASVP